MEFVGFETCEKLMWTSVRGHKNKNKSSKQGIPKSNMDTTSPSAT